MHRLRPSGAAGMLVTSAEAFADYQKTRPDVEHQALVRARVVYGDPQLTAHLTQYAGDYDAAARRQNPANRSAGNARENAPISAINIAIALISKPMKAELPISEFITQYLVLRYAP